MKKVLIIAGVVLLLLIIGYVALKNTAVDPKEIVIDSLDLSTVEDGIYEGEYVTPLVSAKVKVTVTDNEITKISITEHNCGTGQPAEAIVDDIVAKQSLNVDTVSGATLSSKVILKAVEIAVTGE